VLTRFWRWNRLVSVAIVAPLVTIDFSFLASNALKIPEGGWFPIVIGAVVFTLLITWKRGRSMLLARLAQETMPIDAFVATVAAAPPARVPGSAVFLTSTAGRVPEQGAARFGFKEDPDTPRCSTKAAGVAIAST
jgi:KUP system potassium uptake protein